MGKHFCATATAFCGVVFFLFASAICAQTTNWTDSTGSWFLPANWSDGVPNMTTSAVVDQDGIAQVNMAGAEALNVSIGFNNSASLGEVDVSGIGSTLTIHGTLDAGFNGTGTLNISSGAAASVDGAFTRIGTHPSGNGTVTVSGTGSTLTLAHELDVGREGTGTLNIQSGGVLNMTGTNRVDIGAQPGGTGTATVTGAGSMWTMNGPLRVGDNGTGTLNIESGGKVSNTTGQIGRDAGAVGTVTVTGTGSTWTNSGFLSIGDVGNGTLNIDSGGMVSNTTGEIGRSAGGVGTVTVTGTGSTWTNSSFLIIGESGNGALHIMSGGAVSNTFAEIGDQPGSTGTVTVDGMGSTWTSSADLEVGAHGGNGSLAITNGGKVSNSDAEVGHDAGSIGMVSVDGMGSQWMNTADLNVGYNGTGTLLITNSGSVTSVGGFIGTFAGSNGRVILDGGLDPMSPAAGWLSTGDIYVGGNASGDGGTALLSVRNESFVTAPNVFVLSQGRLDGNGFIFGNVDNSGLVAPGNTVGTLFVQGNYTQNSNGTLQIEIGGLNAGVTSDLLQVGGAGGNAMLNGTLQLVRVNNFLPQPGDRVNIINDTVSHTGTFSDVDLVNWGLIHPVPMYDEPNDIYVVFELSPFTSLSGLTPNQESVARALDEAFSDECLPLETFSLLGSIPMNELPRALDLIAPEELTAIYQMSFSYATVHTDNLIRRMDDIQVGSAGYCPAPSVEVQSSGKDDKNVAMGNKNAVAPVIETRECQWGFFINGTGDFVEVDGDFNAQGYDTETGSLIAGADYRIGNHFAIGIDGGYVGGDANLTDDGHIQMKGARAGGYATAFGKLFGFRVHVDGAVDGGWNSYDTKRAALSTSGFRGNGFAQGDTDGSEFNAMISTGTDWTMFGCLNVATWSTLQYSDVNIDGFTEHGSLIPLHYPGQDEKSIRGTTGLRVTYDWKFGQTIVRPEARVAWLHEYGDRAVDIKANFIDCPTSFTVHGPELGRDAALVSGGFSVQWSGCLSTYVHYDGVVGRDNYNSGAVSGGLRFGF